MRDPFLLTGPAVVAFSGGRTSGYMLWRILQSHGGTLPADVKVIFCNTGKERPETLDFVERCSQQWGVDIVWLEYRHSGKRLPPPVGEKKLRKAAGKHGFVIKNGAELVPEVRKHQWDELTSMFPERLLTPPNTHFPRGDWLGQFNFAWDNR